MACHHHHVSEFGKAFFWAILLNAVYILIEMIYAHEAHSHSLLADAVHNIGDVSGLMLAWFAHGLMFRAAAARFSYGYKKLTIVASLINAVLLLLFCCYIGCEAVLQFHHRSPVDTHTVGWVALLGILVNGGTAWLFVHGQHDLNIKGAFLHLAADALVSLGVLIGAGLQFLSGWLWVDAVVSLLIVGIIVLSTWGLLRDSLHMLLAAVPKNVDDKAVVAYLESIDGVASVHDVHIWGLSTQEVALTAHLVMPNHVMLDEAIREVNEALWTRFGIRHVTLQVEKGTSIDPCGQAERCT